MKFLSNVIVFQESILNGIRQRVFCSFALYKPESFEFFCETEISYYIIIYKSNWIFITFNLEK